MTDHAQEHDAHEHDGHEHDGDEHDGHEHDGHADDGDEHDGHEHHHHFASYEDELDAMREEARHYYLHQFDWRGQRPPPDWSGPRWYPPDEGWRIPAWLDRAAPGTGEQVTLPTSTGKLRPMTVAGQLVFPAEGREQRLTAYRPHAHPGEPESLFVPFRDATSGSETYGSGRYIDLPYDDETDDYELDFNLAYSPSCAYSPAYDCPFPPPGNRIDVAVRAGEMNPFEH